MNAIINRATVYIDQLDGHDMAGGYEYDLVKDMRTAISALTQERDTWKSAHDAIYDENKQTKKYLVDAEWGRDALKEDNDRMKKNDGLMQSINFGLSMQISELKQECDVRAKSADDKIMKETAQRCAEFVLTTSSLPWVSGWQSVRVMVADAIRREFAL